MGNFLGGPEEPKIDQATLNRQEEERKRTETEKNRAQEAARTEQAALNTLETRKRGQRIGQRSLLTGGATGLGGGGAV